ncbi:gamma-glutamyl-gamma-aminobutyrate hydrolase family protein [Clavibacter sp. CT19]|uniref:gamma-glutamyl-gamma-aminobutyrate hydrolase family protein n=1 Tax=unclassified Clavibacter TaxID=2626594 RepID=UPI0022EB68A5|nr:gamma-glutamyl-gamma-aminobutyrate hydrolase family protein [Clavibacter sp. CT19]MDA3804928.1 gamma-glutamyl-gamma-aminobutyrate hydrolase family protein [Clavibacter sp. CT19]
MTSGTAGRPPLVGVVVGRQRAAFGAWDLVADVADARYADGVARHGGLPVLVPLAPGEGSADDLVRRLDGLLLTGGPDIDPARYGAAADPRTGEPERRRDDAELHLVAAALRRRLPVLAVCRGAQLLAVAGGGTLHQHIERDAGGDEHLVAPGVLGSTRISLAPGSRVHEALGAEARVRCHHHQSIATTGPGLRVTATTADGLVEAVEGPREDGFVVGVQWHPEADASSSGLLAAFVDAARGAPRRRP